MSCLVKSFMSVIVVIIIVVINLSFSNAQVNVQIIEIEPVKTAIIPETGKIAKTDRLNYVISVGDFNGDGDFDYLPRLSLETPISPTFKTRTYCYLSDGTYLWTLNNQTSRDRYGIKTASMAVLSAWDFDHDGKDELVTNIAEEIVMIDNVDTRTDDIKKNIIRRYKLPDNPGWIMISTIAFLEKGPDPYTVIVYCKEGKQNQPVMIALDKDLKLFKTFNFPKDFWIRRGDIILPYDVDNDGLDEIAYSHFIIDNDLKTTILSMPELEYEGRKCGSKNVNYGIRFFINDFDPGNPGLEWYVITEGWPETELYPGFIHEPTDWKGPYLIDIDQKKVIWHHHGDMEKFTGWGKSHRGWIGEIDTTLPGMESWARGFYWDENEWQNAVAGKNYIKLPDWRSVREKGFLYDGKGNVLARSHLDEKGNTKSGQEWTSTGYLLHWDDDADMEFYNYREAKLYSNFYQKDDELIFSHPYKPGGGAGEVSICDIRGDWREEIIAFSGTKLFVISNGEPTKYSDLPSPRIGSAAGPRTKHSNYRLHMASIGSGLSKPGIPDPDWLGWWFNRKN